MVIGEDCYRGRLGGVGVPFLMRTTGFRQIPVDQGCFSSWTDCFPDANHHFPAVSCGSVATEQGYRTGLPESCPLGRRAVGKMPESDRRRMRRLQLRRTSWNNYFDFLQKSNYFQRENPSWRCVERCFSELSSYFFGIRIFVRNFAAA